MFILATAGLALFIYWAVTRKFGRRELDRAIFRSNSMPDYLPVTVVCGWLGIYIITAQLAKSLTQQMPNWQQEFIAYSIFAFVEVVIIVFILAAARRYFTAGLAGFGLHAKGVLKDIAVAAAIFIAVWPLVTAALFLIVKIGTIIEGPDFQMEQNEGLTVILENSQLSLRILMIFFAAVITPIFEELVFRGLVQSYFRNIGYSPWQAVFIASIIFSLLHPWMHLPALIILSVAIGYAYERSGSLLRSIFIHCFFNSAMIAFALLGK
jgi:membrane protease YdiL (CAAX protease family)